VTHADAAVDLTLEQHGVDGLTHVKGSGDSVHGHLAGPQLF
jgi:hypothetical protein